jgi:hypothetical protein
MASGTQRDYTLAFSRSGVDQVEKGALTIWRHSGATVSKGRVAVLVWLRKHGRPRRTEVTGPARMCLPPQQNLSCHQEGRQMRLFTRERYIVPKILGKCSSSELVYVLNLVANYGIHQIL